MEKSYTIGEVAEGFSVERRTIERWLIRAQMMTGDDTQDGRVKVLSQAQVNHLAALHRTTFTPPAQVAPPSAESQLAALEERLTTRMNERFAAERRAWQREIGGLRQRIETLEQRLHENASQSHSTGQQTALPVQDDEQDLQPTVPIRAITPEMLAKAAETASPARSERQQTASSRSPNPQHRAAEMGVQYFAILHRLTDDQIRKALQLDKRHQYLTQAQRATCYRLLHTLSGFRRCDGCPKIPDGEHT